MALIQVTCAKNTDTLIFNFIGEIQVIETYIYLHPQCMSQEIKKNPIILSTKIDYINVTIYCFVALTLHLIRLLYYFGSACNLRSPVFTRDSKLKKCYIY